MKKIISIVLIFLMLIVIIIIATLGFNVGKKYSENSQINIYIGKEVKKEDLESIAEEIFGKNKSIVQLVELYNDMAQITVKEVTDEQIEELNTKINEKYELENTIGEELIVTQNANARLRDLIYPYLLPIAISGIIIIIYNVIRFRKVGKLKVLYKTIMFLVVPQAILASIYAIFRIPITRMVSVLSIILYITSAFGSNFYLSKK